LAAGNISTDLTVCIFIGNQNHCPENVADLDLETDEMSVELKLAPSQRFSRRVAIGELEKYVKEGLTSGELQRQHAVSITYHLPVMVTVLGLRSKGYRVWQMLEF
jgi:hypothetical protein